MSNFDVLKFTELQTSECDDIDFPSVVTIVLSVKENTLFKHKFSWKYYWVWTEAYWCFKIFLFPSFNARVGQLCDYAICLTNFIASLC